MKVQGRLADILLENGKGQQVRMRLSELNLEILMTLERENF
jgi:hypothetical protein